MTVDLDRAEQLAAAATRGPWDTDESVCCVYAPDDDVRCVAQVAVGGSGTEADAEFIAAARELVPALVARVRALTDAGNRMADELGDELGHEVSHSPRVDAALTAWRLLVDDTEARP